MSNITERQIVNFFKEFYRIKARFPTFNDLNENGITREVIRQRFGNKSAVEKIASEEISSQFLEAPKDKTLTRLKKNQKRYIIVGVQNNTYIDQDVMACLMQYAKKNKADILALPMYYRNPTSISESNRLEKEYWWDSNFPGKYVTENMQLGPYLKLMAEHRITVTAMNPLAGLEHLAGKYSAIFANPQFHMKVVPESGDKLPHILHTTGTVCQDSNFSKTNAGGKAKQFATKGALLVEIDNELFNIRQLEYKDDCICDLGHVYKKDKIIPISEYGESVMVWGDIHAEVADQTTVKASMALSKECNITTHYLHDILDFTCQSHHNKHNFLMRYMLNKNGKDNVTLAIKDVAEFIKGITDTGADVKIVDSNHHDHITRWINEKDFKAMGASNAYFYVCLIKRLMEVMEMDTDTLVIENDNALKAALEILNDNKDLGDEVEFLSRNESHVFKGVELSQHGDVGPNGCRGSITAFAKTNGPLVIGHSHTPGIYRHVFQVGKTAHLKQSYMRGYSSHLHTHCVIYPNGGRALINIVGGKYKV